MHHAARPQHIRHHMNHHQQHQGPIHHQHPPPPPTVGMSIAPQTVAGPQHHLAANVAGAPPPPHSSTQPINQYVPPHQRNDVNRFNHHSQPRLQQQPMHQQSSQSKIRSNTSNHPNGLISTSSLPPPHQSQHIQQQQPQTQPPAQHSHPKQFHQGAAIPSHQGNISKHQGSLRHAGQQYPNKLSTSPPKKILQVSQPPPNMSSSQPKLSQYQQSNAVSIVNTPINLPNMKSQTNVPKHVTILSKPPPSIPQLPITQPPPQLAQANSMSAPPPNGVVPHTQVQQIQNVQDDAQHPGLQQNMQQQQITNQQQQILQQQQQQPLKTTAAQLHNNIANQTTISSTTNSVLVSITHQQMQQTVVVQQQQQQAQAQQSARQGQPLENQPPIVSILQNTALANSTSSCENNILSNSIGKEISSELNCSDTINSLNDSLANNKEKTPMCLVNELARYNRIQHQYRLTSETGPAHAKRFTVTLKLGDEEYTAEGLSIKKAQHLAAADAISKTKYQHPPPKSHRLKNKLKAGAGSITPTVELNALAMKLGEPTIYLLDNQSVGDGTVQNNPRGLPSNAPIGGLPQQVLPPVPATGSVPPIPPQQPPNPYVAHQQAAAPNYFTPNQYQNFNRPNVPNGVYATQRFPGYYPKRPFTKGPMKFAPNDGIITYSNPKEPCRVTLVVGMRKFVGVGSSLQAARHDAATRALEVIKPLVNEQAPDISNDSSSEDPNSDLKSPISLVHEIALKRNLSVVFEVVSERGPPHMKTFVTKCKVGDIVTEGEGNGKKLSKKRAAVNMLDELRKLPPMSPSRAASTPAKIKAAQKQRKPQPIKRKSRNIIKEQSQGGEVEEEVNPISKLIQIQQALKEREPVYTVVEERGAPRRREFVIEVSASGCTARGIGTNKKMAKRLAAENLLTILGYSTTTPIISKDPNKLVNNNSTNANNNVDGITDKSLQQRVKFHDNNIEGKTNVSGNQGRQIVPGIILMQQQHQPQQSPPTQQQSSAITTPMQSSSVNGLKHESDAPVGNSGASTATTSGFSTGGVRPKDQLLYLGQLLGFEVQYSDYPKGNHGAYLSIVTLSTEPPQLCHGSGNKIEESQDEASLTALRLLSELGLDNVKPKKSNGEEIKT